MKTSDMATATRHPASLDEFIEAYESVRARAGHADLAQFLPDREHPLYLSVLRELIRIDLEFGWENGRPKRLEQYQIEFPEVFRDANALQEIAFEEYRLRLQAGEQPSPAEYHERFGVATADWPLKQISMAAEAASAESQPGLAESWPESLRQLATSDPHAADRVAQAVTRMPQVGENFLGFHLVGELGRGAFGKVFLAQQGHLANRLVALKVTTDILGEPQTLAQLQHTNIVPIYSLHRAGPFHAICMPYLGSATLADILRDLENRDSLPASGKRLVSTLLDRKPKTSTAEDSGTPASSHEETGSQSGGQECLLYQRPAASRYTATLEMLEGLSYVEAVLWMATRLADGLAHAHERGILHRDLKPANILLTDEGQPMLLDFNLSEDTKLQSRAAAAHIGGTLPYMAPEQLAAFQDSNEPVDARSDIYSLGIILYELLTGRRPFSVPKGSLKSIIADMRAERQGPAPAVRCWNSAVSPAVESIIRKCLTPEPGWRYQTARQLQDDLQRHLANQPLKYAKEPSLRERLRKWHRRKPYRMAVVAATVMALLATGLLAWGLMASAEKAAAKLQIVKNDALTHFHRTQDDMKRARFLLNARADEREEFEEGEAACREVLNRYEVLNNPAWQDLSIVHYLSTENQDRLRGDIGECLLLLARATSLRQPQSVEAHRLNRLALSTFGEDLVPRACWLQLAELMASDGRDDEAQVLFDRAEATPLRTTRDYALVAAEHATRRRFRKAMPLLEEAVRLDPQDFWMQFYLAVCNDRLGRDGDAVACYSASIAIWPDFPWAYFNRGQVYLREKDYRRAWRDFDHVLHLRSNLPEAYVNRALAKQGLGKHPEAIEDLDSALARGARQTRIYFMRGRIREQAGDRAGARQDYETGLRLEPTDEKSWVARGVALLPRDPQLALADFDRALELSPRSLTGLQAKAHVLAERLNRQQEAVKMLDTALFWHPDSVPARIGRGVVLARLGKREAAHKDAKDSLEQDGRASNLYRAACIYALTSRQHPEDEQEGIRLLRLALRSGYGFDLLEKDTDLDPVRNLPDFQRLLHMARVLESGASEKPPQR